MLQYQVILLLILALFPPLPPLFILLSQAGDNYFHSTGLLLYYLNNVPWEHLVIALPSKVAVLAKDNAIIED